MSADAKPSLSIPLSLIGMASVMFPLDELATASRTSTVPRDHRLMY
jgi:hypothetical protein